jgi:OOP family OmpA-OmpF porin
MKKFIITTLLSIAFTSSFAETSKVDFIVYFQQGSTELSEESMDNLNDQILSLNPSKVSIIGHADEDRDSKKNFLLSQERADSVKDFLIVRGLNSTTIESSLGAGQSDPSCFGKSKKCNAQNRRVEVKVEYIK